VVNRTLRAALSLCLVLSAVVTSGSATHAGERVRFNQCSELQARFPSGVAKSAAAAQSAMALGYERPAVRKKIFRKNRKALGPPTAGSLCLTKIEVKEFAFQYNLDSSLPADWVAEFNTIMNNLGAVLPISERRFRKMSSPTTTFIGTRSSHTSTSIFTKSASPKTSWSRRG
jgi:hypothetical protein